MPDGHFQHVRHAGKKRGQVLLRQVVAGVDAKAQRLRGSRRAPTRTQSVLAGPNRRRGRRGPYSGCPRLSPRPGVDLDALRAGLNEGLKLGFSRVDEQ